MSADTGSESVFTRAIELLEVSEATLRVMTCIDLSKPAQKLLSSKSCLLAAAPSLPAALRLAKDLELFKREIVLGTSYRTYKTLEEDVEDLVQVMRGVLKKLIKSHNIETELITACLRVEGQVTDLLAIPDYPSLSHAHGLLHLLREQLRVLQLVMHSVSGPSQAAAPSSLLLNLLTQIEAKTVLAMLAVGLEKPEMEAESTEDVEQKAVRKGNRVVALLEQIVGRGEMLHLAESEGNAWQGQVETLQMELEASEDQFKLLRDRTNKVESDLSALQEALAKSQAELKATKQRLKAQAARSLLRYIGNTQKRAFVQSWKDAGSLVPEPLPVPLPIITEVPAIEDSSANVKEPLVQAEEDTSATIAKPEAESPALKSAPIGKPGTVGKAGGKPGAAPAKPGVPPKSGAATPGPKSGVTSPVPKPGATPKAGASQAPRDPTTPRPKPSSPLGIPVAKPGAAKKAGKK